MLKFHEKLNKCLVVFKAWLVQLKQKRALVLIRDPIEIIDKVMSNRTLHSSSSLLWQRYRFEGLYGL